MDKISGLTTIPNYHKLLKSLRERVSANNYPLDYSPYLDVREGVNCYGYALGLSIAMIGDQRGMYFPGGPSSGIYAETILAARTIYSTDYKIIDCVRRDLKALGFSIVARGGGRVSSMFKAIQGWCLRRFPFCAG